MFLYCDSGRWVTIWPCSDNSSMFFWGRTVSDLSLLPHTGKRGEIFLFSLWRFHVEGMSGRDEGKKPRSVTERAARRRPRDWHALTAGKTRSGCPGRLRTRAPGSGSCAVAAAGGEQLARRGPERPEGWFGWGWRDGGLCLWEGSGEGAGHSEGGGSPPAAASPVGRREGGQ